MLVWTKIITYLEVQPAGGPSSSSCKGLWPMVFWPLHSAKPNKWRVADIFSCFLGLNKRLYIWSVHLVWIKEITLWKASSSYKIAVIIQNSWSPHALKVTIFTVLLIPRQEETWTNTFRGERHQNLSLRSERESIRFWPDKNSSLITGPVF